MKEINYFNVERVGYRSLAEALVKHEYMEFLLGGTNDKAGARIGLTIFRDYIPNKHLYLGVTYMGISEQGRYRYRLLHKKSIKNSDVLHLLQRK